MKKLQVPERRSGKDRREHPRMYFGAVEGDRRKSEDVQKNTDGQIKGKRRVERDFVTGIFSS